MLKTVERALTVLEIVSRSVPSIQVKELSVQLGHNLSSTYHIVNTLLSRRYLVRNPSGDLSVGPQIGMLNAALIRNGDFTAMVGPYITGLADSSGETVYLTRFRQSSVVIQMVVESQHSLRVTGLDVGYSGAEDRRASGRAVLAQLSRPELERVLSKLYSHDKPQGPDAQQLYAELDLVRRQGFAFDEEAYEPGVCCVAAPYFNADGTVAGSVGVSAPALRIERMRSDIRQQVLDSATEITDLLAGNASNGATLVEPA